MPALMTAYIASAASFLVLDLFWLAVVARGFYREQLGGLMVDKVALAPAVAFYVLFIAGLVAFAVRPALAEGDWRLALLFGAGLGLFAYGTYDLTNWATLRDWPGRMSLVDMAWGTALSGVTALAGYGAARWFASP